MDYKNTHEIHYYTDIVGYNGDAYVLDDGNITFENKTACYNGTVERAVDRSVSEGFVVWSVVGLGIPLAIYGLVLLFLVAYMLFALYAKLKKLDRTKELS